MILVLTFDIRPPENHSTVFSLFKKKKLRPLGYSWTQVRSVPIAGFSTNDHNHPKGDSSQGSRNFPFRQAGGFSSNVPSDGQTLLFLAWFSPISTSGNCPSSN